LDLAEAATVLAHILVAKVMCYLLLPLKVVLVAGNLDQDLLLM
jgi:hypothetical protein